MGSRSWSESRPEMTTPTTPGRVFIHTFGCQMNDLDSEKMYALLALEGYTRAEDADNADLILVNTCSVREKAVQKLYSLLGRLREKEGVTIGVTGCVAQHEGRQLARKFPFVKLVMGPDAVPRVGALVAEASETSSFVVDVDFHEGLEYPFVSELPPVTDFTPVTAFVTIQKGCDNHCAYCIVPMTRGGEVSRPSGEVLAEVKALAARGVREVTLLGQNVNSYGRKVAGERSFAELLELIDREVEGLRRIRFTTSHPRDLSSGLVRAFATLPKLCPYIHLPVQSGSSAILKRMRRGYSREHYLQKVADLREAVPDMAISTDFIVGFPGETERDFEETMSLLQGMRFDASFSFIYSPRPGTPSLDYDQEVPLEEKKRRLAHLQEVQREISLERNEALVGKVVPVLIEGASRHSQQELTGRTPGNKTVNFEAGGVFPGEEIAVELVGANVNSLRGAVVSS